MIKKLDYSLQASKGLGLICSKINELIDHANGQTKPERKKLSWKNVLRMNISDSPAYITKLAVTLGYSYIAKGNHIYLVNPDAKDYHMTNYTINDIE